MRVPTEEVHGIIRQYRRTNCPDTARALAVALVQARKRILALAAELATVRVLHEEGKDWQAVAGELRAENERLRKIEAAVRARYEWCLK